MTPTSGLAATEVSVHFGGVVALAGASIAAPRGSITGLIGPNGAGKSTLFDVCCGYRKPLRGTVSLDGADLTKASVATRVRAGIGRSFQRMELFWSLSVRENIELALEAVNTPDNPLAFLRVGRKEARRKAREAADHFLGLMGLTEYANVAAVQLPTGLGRQLELARVLARQPSMLLLDEPSAGLDVDETARLGRILCDIMSDKEVGILLVEHDMSLVLSICTRITVLDFGKVLFEGTPSEVRASPEVRAAYLGNAVPPDGEQGSV